MFFVLFSVSLSEVSSFLSDSLFSPSFSSSNILFETFISGVEIFLVVTVFPDSMVSSDKLWDDISSFSVSSKFFPQTTQYLAFLRFLPLQDGQIFFEPVLPMMSCSGTSDGNLVFEFFDTFTLVFSDDSESFIEFTNSISLF